MDRRAGFVLGLFGLFLPTYLFYIIIEVPSRPPKIQTVLYSVSFFYRFFYHSESSIITHNWISRAWFNPERGANPTEFYLYLASFALAILGLLVILRFEGVGTLSFLLSGILSLAAMCVQFPNINCIFALTMVHFWPKTTYPIPIGSIFLILAGLMGRRS